MDDPLITRLTSISQRRTGTGTTLVMKRNAIRFSLSDLDSVGFRQGRSPRRSC